jgi:hypothetical protein
MGLNNITFILGQGGLGRPLPGEDYISGLGFFCADNKLPSGFTTTNRVKQFFSPADAEAAGIKADYSDATAAAGTVLVTAAGTNGDTIDISVTTPSGAVDLGTYTKTATEANVTAVGAAIAAIINAGTVNHGFSAVNTTGSVAITAPQKYGVYLNTGTKLVTTLSAGATLAVTVTQFSGGAASLQAVWHYHISEFFRIQPKGQLWVGFFAVPGSYTFTAEVGSLVTAASGKIRQIGFYKDGAAFATADIQALHSALNGQFGQHKPLIGVYAADISGTADITTMADASTLASNLVMPVIGQDGGALGAFLYATYGKSITDLGAVLGALALASVEEDISWVAKFNMSDGTELDIPAFANGVLVSSLGQSTENVLSALQDKAYNFLRKFVGVAGTYNNESRMAVTITSDYAYAENNRTIQKAVRGVYTSLIPALGAPITLNSDGTLTDVSIEYFKTLAETNLFQMERDGEISSFEVDIDSTQNVLSTGQLVIAINIVPVGVARNIIVKIGYNVSIS